jgi:2-polyprenyl-6-hydroxyphenyl methylase/3-demethylubiquinone-9 3-methyltransferase
MSQLEQDFYESDVPEVASRAYLALHATQYDQNRFKNTQRFLVERVPLSELSILEVGCGGGLWSAFFAQHSRSLTCNDLRPNLVEAARLYVTQTISHEATRQIRWLTGDLREVVAGELYDFIFLKDVIEHIEEDVAFLQMLNDLLRSGGQLYLATQNNHSLNYVVEKAYHHLIGNKEWCGWDSTHVRFYNSKLLRHVAHQAGFIPVAWHGMYHLPYRAITRFLLGAVWERQYLHLIEDCVGDQWPYSVTGWAIGVLLQKT